MKYSRVNPARVCFERSEKQTSMQGERDLGLPSVPLLYSPWFVLHQPRSRQTGKGSPGRAAENKNPGQSLQDSTRISTYVRFSYSCCLGFMRLLRLDLDSSPRSRSPGKRMKFSLRSKLMCAGFPVSQAQHRKFAIIIFL